MALCHSSYSHENGLPQSNERLEFLGDSVLGMAVARVLYESCPEATEGELSGFRAELVCRDALAAWAEQVGLEEVLLRGKSMKKLTPPSVFADGMEAVLGAVYLEGGYDAAERVVRRRLFALNRGANGAVFGGFAESERDAKSRLQVFLQAEAGVLPRYEIESVTGPSHAPLFRVRVFAAGKSWAGEGPGRKTAELLAAAAALKELNGLKEARLRENENTDTEARL